MLRLFTDFQAVDPEGACFILNYGNTDLESCIEELGVSRGDKVILDAHEDFEVQGRLAFKFVKALNREAWVAYPDWSTRIDKSSNPT